MSYTHDRDFGTFKDYPKGKELFRGRGWCPPSQAEYPEILQLCLAVFVSAFGFADLGLKKIVILFADLASFFKFLLLHLGLSEKKV